MDCQLSQSTFPMPHSLTGRFAAAASEASRAAVLAFQAAWRQRAPRANQPTALEWMADINEHTLRDIGAPNWLVAQAVERKDAHRLHLLDLHRS